MNCVRGSIGIASIVDKMRENRLDRVMGRVKFGNAKNDYGNERRRKKKRKRKTEE